jgi:hypothetical protein
MHHERKPIDGVPSLQQAAGSACCGEALWLMTRARGQFVFEAGRGHLARASITALARRQWHSAGRWGCDKALALFALICCVSSVAAQTEETRPTFTPRRFVPPMPAIVDAPVVRADRIKDRVSDNELVLGVVVGDEARAYPINMLTGPRREIINDTLGGRAIAATW